MAKTLTATVRAELKALRPELHQQQEEPWPVPTLAKKTRPAAQRFAPMLSSTKEAPNEDFPSSILIESVIVCCG